MDGCRAQLRERQGPGGGLGKGAEEDAAVTFSHPHSSHTTKGPAGAKGAAAWAADPHHPLQGSGLEAQDSRIRLPSGFSFSPLQAAPFALPTIQ